MTINTADRRKIAVVGPTYPYRGGIAHYTTLMVRNLRIHRSVVFYSFKSQYPRWLFPGRTDKDPSQNPIQESCQYLLSPLNPLTWINTSRHIRADHPDALILPWWIPFWAPAWFSLTRLVQLGRSTSIIYVCHNVLPHERSWWDRTLARITLSSGNGFVVHSQQDAIHLRSLLPHANIKTTPLPTYQAVGQISTDRRHARKTLGLTESKLILLFFGFVRSYKGLDVLLEALDSIDKQLDVHLLVIGEMWNDKANYLAQIERLDLASRVTIVDQYVPNEQLGRYFSAADVAVLPYRSATQSGVVQMAFGYGKPVITTDVGGLAESVTDGLNGLIVPPENPSALADAITRFYQQDLEATLTAGVKTSAHRFSWEHLIDILHELIANTHSGPVHH